MSKVISNMNTHKSFYPIGKSILLNGWVVIFLAFVSIFLFLYVIGPLGLKTEYIKPMADFIEENEIQANAYYYTEVDEFFMAERHMREHLALAPGSKH